MIIGTSTIERMIIIALSQEGAGGGGRGTMLIIRSIMLVPMIMMTTHLGEAGGAGGCRLLLGYKGRYLDSAPWIPGTACPPGPPSPLQVGGPKAKEEGKTNEERKRNTKRGIRSTEKTEERKKKRSIKRNIARNENRSQEKAPNRAQDLTKPNQNT